MITAGRTLIVGCGSPHGGDDGAGLVVARDLRRLRSPDIEVHEIGDDPFALLDCIDGVDSVVLVDAVSSGARPGTIHLCAVPSISIVPRSLARTSTHGYGLEDAIDLASRLGYRVPRIGLIGIEMATVTGPEVTAAVRRAIRRVVADLDFLIDRLSRMSPRDPTASLPPDEERDDSPSPDGQPHDQAAPTPGQAPDAPAGVSLLRSSERVAVPDGERGA